MKGFKENYKKCFEVASSLYPSPPDIWTYKANQSYIGFTLSRDLELNLKQQRQ